MSQSVSRTPWGSPSVVDAYCQSCPWQIEGDQLGDSRRESARIVSAARFHVKSSGHTVRLERNQAAYLEPA